MKDIIAKVHTGLYLFTSLTCSIFLIIITILYSNKNNKFNKHKYKQIKTYLNVALISSIVITIYFAVLHIIAEIDRSKEKNVQAFPVIHNIIFFILSLCTDCLLLAAVIKLKKAKQQHKKIIQQLLVAATVIHLLKELINIPMGIVFFCINKEHEEV